MGNSNAKTNINDDRLLIYFANAENIPTFEIDKYFQTDLEYVILDFIYGHFNKFYYDDIVIENLSHNRELKTNTFIIHHYLILTDSTKYKKLITSCKHILKLVKFCYQDNGDNVVELQRTVKCRNKARTFVKTKVAKHFSNNKNTCIVYLFDCGVGNISAWKERLFHLSTIKPARSLDCCTCLDLKLILKRLRRKRLMICSEKRTCKSQTLENTEFKETAHCDEKVDTDNLLKLVNHSVSQNAIKTHVHKYFEKDRPDEAIHIVLKKPERNLQSPINLHKNIKILPWKDYKFPDKPSVSRVLFEDNFTPAPVVLWVAPFARSDGNTLETIFSKFTSATPPTKEETMAYEMLRLCTMHDFPIQTTLSFLRLAQAGFYYGGNGDEVICFACGVKKSGWRADEDPIDVHRQLSPNCPFFQNARLNKPVLYAEDMASQNYLLDVPSGSTRDFNTSRRGRNEIDVATAHAVGFDTLENTVAKTLNGPGKDSGYGTCSGSDLALDNSDPTDQDRQQGRDRFPQYSSFDKRLETYKNWPSDRRQNPRELAQAGLFYTNDRDFVKCFRCGIGIYDWLRDDNPWIEHTRLSSQCSFILEVKGQTFISRVLGVAAEAERKEQGASEKTPSSESGNLPTTSAVSQSNSTTSETNSVPNDNRGWSRQTPAASTKTNTVSNSSNKTPASLASENAQSDAVNRHSALAASASTANDLNNDRRNVDSNGDQSTGNQNSDANAGSNTANSSQTSVAGVSATAAKTTSNGSLNTHSAMDHNSGSASSNEHFDSKSQSDQAQSKKTKKKSRKKKSSKQSKEDMNTTTSPELNTTTSPELNGSNSASDLEVQEASGNSGQSIASRIPEDQENTDPKTLKKQIIEMKELTICKICLDNKVSVVFLPCGHLVACKSCSRSLRKCPICRKHIKNTVETQI